MKTGSARSILAAAVAVSGLLAAPVLAQEAENPPSDGPAITVEAPRQVAVPIERSPYTGAPIAVSTVRIPVLYGDLDLTRDEDAERLMTRVGRVAQDACGELDRLLPFSEDSDCVRRAKANGEAAASEAIAAARGEQ
ncbi:hypothetical protein B2G71_10670 [Novosphingobium sp. PC22D]|uniref:UrcA family protein n=1 Tax=Novosphingobium sp. PC22D TaxID=1962403 RepID=UPI000BF018D7|nr:UrcA family protein [Novosphingobium sp. PC22D]PEQ12842.1 hypothetical protein B2G71_10670 [Novosphingobium sp. PC22D]